MAMFKAKYEYIIVLEWLFVGNQHFANISRLTRSLINVFSMIHTHTEEHQPKFPSLSLPHGFPPYFIMERKNSFPSLSIIHAIILSMAAACCWPQPTTEFAHYNKAIAFCFDH